MGAKWPDRPTHQRRMRYAKTLFFALMAKVLLLALTMLVASMVVFALSGSLPGNAAQVMLGESASPGAVFALAEKLALNAPAPQRYGAWLYALLHGDGGISFAYHTPVATLMAERLAISLPLAGLAFGLTLLIGLGVGLGLSLTALSFGEVASSRWRLWLKRLLHGMGVAYCTLAVVIPNFWIGLVLILLFSLHLQWFPAGGFPESADARATAAALFLPALTLAIGQGAILARLTHSLLRACAKEPFARTAIAKGLSARGVLWRHVLQNASAPLLTVMALQFGNLLAGSIVVESVFFLPGLGRLLVTSLANRDIPVITDCLMLVTALIILVRMATDLMASLTDPRRLARP